MNQFLQEQLEKVRAAYEELGAKYQHDMFNASQHAAELNALHLKMAEENKRHQADKQRAEQRVETLQKELEKQQQAHDYRVSKDQAVITSLTAEVKALRQKVEKHQADVQGHGQSVEALDQAAKTPSAAEHSALQQALEEANQKYQTDIRTAFWMVDRLENDLVEERRRFSQDKTVIVSLKAERKSLQQKLEEENIMHQEEMHKAGQMFETLQRELKKQQRLNTAKASRERSLVAILKSEQQLRLKIAQDNNKYQADIKRAGQTVENLQSELQKHSQLISTQVSAVESLKAEHEAQRQKMAEEATVSQQRAVQREQELLQVCFRTDLKLLSLAFKCLHLYLLSLDLNSVSISSFIEQVLIFFGGLFGHFI